MTTLTTLRANVRLALASTSDWPNATLDLWIADAIRLYSALFPRKRLYSLSLSTGTQAYALPGGHDMQGVVSVEYPTGESPKSMLYEVLESDPAFTSALDVYAIRAIADTVTAANDTAAHNIVFAETVATGQTATIIYLTSHNIPSADTDVITVPNQHWEAITSYAIYRSYSELEADEAITIDTSNVSIVHAMLGQGTRAAWNRYRAVMDRLLSLDSRSVVVNWSAGLDSRDW